MTGNTITNGTINGAVAQPFGTEVAYVSGVNKSWIKLDNFTF